MSTLIKASPHVTSIHPPTGETDQVPLRDPRRSEGRTEQPCSGQILSLHRSTVLGKAVVEQVFTVMGVG
jgi:hypothetical protein